MSTLDITKGPEKKNAGQGWPALLRPNQSDKTPDSLYVHIKTSQNEELDWRTLPVILILAKYLDLTKFKDSSCEYSFSRSYTPITVF